MAAATSPQHLAVGEAIQKPPETCSNINPKQTYAERLLPNKSAVSKYKVELNPVNLIHGEPTVEFTIEEINSFTIEEGLHQAVILKFSYGKPDIQELRQIIPKQFDIKGYCNVGQLEFRHILVRCDLFDDFVQLLSRTTGYVKAKGDEYFFRAFPWTMGFNPREETSRAVVWISMPDLPANLFAKKSLMSIASAVGKPLAVDKATQDRTRPSTARVKVMLDLLDKHPKRVKIQIVDKSTGKLVEHYQQIVYDSLPKYCTFCKHQGHGEKSCRWRIEEDRDDADQVHEVESLDSTAKLTGDARDFINAKKAGQQEKQTLVEQQVSQIAGGKEIVNMSSDPAVNENTGVNPIVEAYDKLDTGNNTAVQIIPAGARGHTTSNVVDDGARQLKNIHNADQFCGVTDQQYTSGKDGDFSTARNLNGEFSIMEQKDGKGAGHLCHVNGPNDDKVGSLGHFKEKDAGSSSAHLEHSIKNPRGHRGESTFVLAGITLKKAKGVGQQEATGNVNNQSHGTLGSLEQFNDVGHVDPLNFQHEATENTPNTIDNVGTCKVKKENTKALVGQKVNSIVQSQDEVQNVKVGVFDILKFKDGGHLNLEFERNASTFEKVENVAVGSHGIHDIEGDFLGEGNFVKIINKDVGSFSHKVNSVEQIIDEMGGQKRDQQLDKGLFINAGSTKENDLKVDAFLMHKNSNFPSSVENFVEQNRCDQIVYNTEGHGGMSTDHGGAKPKKEGNNGIAGIARPTDGKNNAKQNLVDDQAHSSNAPILHFSNPIVERIIKDAQHEMMMKETIVQQPLVALNTSVYDVPSNSVESYGDYGGESGQLMISTGNKNEVHEKRESARKVSYSDCKAVTSSKRRHQQLVTTKNAISVDDRKLLDAMLTENPIDILSRIPYSPVPTISDKRNETQEIPLRQIPMRAAKQKGIASSTSTRSNKSNKK